MKKISKIIALQLVVMLMFNCSSVVEVSNSWKDVDSSSFKDKKVIVMSKTNNEIFRQQFEIDLTEKLTKNEISSVESYKLFPELNFNKELSKKELERLKDEYLEKGIDIVLVTELKDIQEYEKTTCTGSSDYYIHSMPIYYGRGFRRGFYSYYGSGYMNTGSIEIVKSNNKKYILETLMYDLTLPENNQLLTVITTVIDNPETLGTTSKDFSNKVSKELLK